MINQHVEYPGERTLLKQPDRFKKRIESKKRAVLQHPLNNLGYHQTSFCRDMFGYEFLVDSEKNNWIDSLRYAVQGGVGLFKVHTHPGETVKLIYFDEEVSTTGEQAKQYLQFQYWLDDMYAAIATRDREAIDYLAQLSPTVNYITDRVGRSFEALWAIADLYKALFSNRENISSVFARIESAFKTTDFSASPEWKSKLESLHLAPLAAIKCLMSGGSEAEFNQHITTALLAHQAYWINNDPENWEGAFSLPLMAVAVIGHDFRGYQITVENDYIPKWLNVDVGNRLSIAEKQIAPCHSASLTLTSAGDEKTQLEGKSLEEQLSHIEYYLDYFFRAEDSINSFEPMFPTLWQVYGKTPAYRFGGSGDELKQFIDEHLDALSKELDQMRTLFVSFYQQGER